MVLIQDASFDYPKGKNWKKKYVQLDFCVSIKELEEQAKMLREQTTEWMKEDGNKWVNQRWLLTAFMEKCQCEFCKAGWDAHEKACKEMG